MGFEPLKQFEPKQQLIIGYPSFTFCNLLQKLFFFVGKRKG